MIRRAWQVLAAPPLSWAAAVLRLVIPIGAGVALVSLIPGVTWPVPVSRLIDLVALYVLLIAIRQRDRARAELAQVRRDAGCD